MIPGWIFTLQDLLVRRGRQIALLSILSLFLIFFIVNYRRIMRFVLGTLRYEGSELFPDRGLLVIRGGGWLRNLRLSVFIKDICYIRIHERRLWQCIVYAILTASAGLWIAIYPLEMSGMRTVFFAIPGFAVFFAARRATLVVGSRDGNILRMKTGRGFADLKKELDVHAPGEFQHLQSVSSCSGTWLWIGMRNVISVAMRRSFPVVWLLLLLAFGALTVRFGMKLPGLLMRFRLAMAVDAGLLLILAAKLHGMKEVLVRFHGGVACTLAPLAVNADDFMKNLNIVSTVQHDLHEMSEKAGDNPVHEQGPGKEKAARAHGPGNGENERTRGNELSRASADADPSDRDRDAHVNGSGQPREERQVLCSKCGEDIGLIAGGSCPYCGYPVNEKES